MMEAAVTTDYGDVKAFEGLARGAAGGRPRVIVAEDSTEMRRLIASVLRSEGYRVTEARDGMELVDLIEASTLPDGEGLPDAVVSDVRMPWLTGMDVLAALDVAGMRMPVILITAFGDAALHAEAQDLGAAAVLDKPFDVEELTSELARVTAVRWR